MFQRKENKKEKKILKNPCPSHLDFGREDKIFMFYIFLVEKYLQNSRLHFLLTILDYNG